MSATTIDLAQGQPTLETLLALAAQGNEVVLTDQGKILATLVPAPPKQEILQKRTPGLQPNAFTYVADDFDDPLPDDFWLGGNP